MPSIVRWLAANETRSERTGRFAVTFPSSSRLAAPFWETRVRLAFLLLTGGTFPVALFSPPVSNPSLFQPLLQVRVGCALTYEAPVAVPFVLHVKPRGGGALVIEEQLRLGAGLPAEEIEDRSEEHV